MNITFALALNNNGIFEKKHFGDTDKFAIYTYENQELSFKEELKNTFKTMDEVQEHGSKKKGSAIISFLKEKGVSVLVSKQFGRNIKMVNQHFVPVIIAENDHNIAVEVLQKHMNWFKDELQNRKENYMLFHIKNGILKMHVKKD
ncbi:MAG: hypothetical protein HN778_03125 [Prolixibacteraceae bacterium]|jgi:predicted Fe-Mo cluster-binding NifX family protein|nr:hypothetical protein [Prolixibacteraceae bacterium]MBT6005435.1 hypothetical protein [Prolixibacteraceae bacterium]MBT6763144.1 hypothetical protein [Prolixibacteraceae bacterium]MBT7000199.1 hypothetical protein [Prolixibacteraceae bacterium]MBT7393804.1 hypothetical protein [Prolixibacteraceae bacterium]